MDVKYILFVRTFSNDSSLFGSYAETTNSCAEEVPDLPNRDKPLLRATLKEICEDYKRIEVLGLQQKIIDSLPNGLRKVFDWKEAGVYYDSCVDQKTLDEFRVGLETAA